MTRSLRLLVLLGTAAAALAACDGARAEADPQAARLDSVVAAGGVVDSSLPIPVLLERFREGIPAVETLADASPDRDALVARVVDAIARADTAELMRARMTLGEFAWLYYPETRYTRPPYELGPEHVYLLTDQNDSKGLTRILRRMAGKTTELVDYRCPPEPRREGPNTYWERCVVELQLEGGVRDTMRLFGAIWERDGRFKLVSYANEL